jgi:hypothetical protein
MYTFTYLNNDGLTPTLFNFDLNAYWVRFGYIPVWSGIDSPISVDEFAQLIVNDGVFHKILYKS